MTSAVQRFAPRHRDAAMLLRIWMIEHGVSNKDLSGALGCHEMNVTLWRTGKRKPGRLYAVKLEELTGGRVTAASWDETKEAT